jgi:hypothetical protein
MNANLVSLFVSVKTNLREQVKPYCGGRSQNRRMARGMPL